METIIGVIITIAIIIYFLAQNSKKNTKQEKYGEAVSELAQMTADKISGVAYSITEPANKKKIRLANEVLASRHGRLYRTKSYWDENNKDRLLKIDNYLKNALDVLELSEEKWYKLGLMFYHIGAIRKLSRSSLDYSKKLPKSDRKHMLTDWREDDLLKEQINALEQALAFFDIRTVDWVEYGDAVIEMYNLFEHSDIKRYGFINSIYPLSNNMHIL